MLGRMLDQTGASLVTLSGGEPLLRRDIFQIVDYLSGRHVVTNFLSNGFLLDDPAIERLGGGRISIFELPLLGDRADLHDRLSAHDGAFDRVTMAVASLKAARQRVVTVFVATKLNLPAWRGTAELAIALGADGIMFNRFNPGGTGSANIELLQASPDELAAALDIAQELTQEYGIGISCSIAMPPCLFDHGRWPKLSFGFCAAGTRRAYYTLDPLGNVRPCNHSPTILGNILERNFDELADSPAMRRFMAAHPAFCEGCRYELQCQGGCKAAAEACYGCLTECDPFLKAYANMARKPKESH
jgi:radical SAM protein with 4Fe4S-binding SPASM domain